MTDLEGKVALITGAARGLGRSHAEVLARHGADIVAIDLCAPIDTVDYGLPTTDDLAETARLVAVHGRRAFTRQADVRELDAMETAVAVAIEAFGRLDIVVANAGIGPAVHPGDDRQHAWSNVIDVNLTGTWTTVEATKHAVIAGGRGGAIVLTSSTAGLKGAPPPSAAAAGYIASKHGVVGLMRAYAHELGPHGIRVNSIHPTAAGTPLVVNPAMQQLMEERGGNAARRAQHLLPVELIDPVDVSNAVLWLVSDAARYVTGVTLPVDAGYSAK
jgi:SDR family mycofactocin-dependent oxidoreductase